MTGKTSREYRHYNVIPFVFPNIYILSYLLSQEVGFLTWRGRKRSCLHGHTGAVKGKETVNLLFYISLKQNKDLFRVRYPSNDKAKILFL